MNQNGGMVKTGENFKSLIMDRNKMVRIVIATMLFVFAALTIFMGGSVIFDWYGIRKQQGDYVPFIVWTNFISGFFYLLATYGFLKLKKWTFWVLMTIAIVLILALIGLRLYIDHGGVFETRTLGAMGSRIILTLIFSGFAYYKIQNQYDKNMP